MVASCFLRPSSLESANDSLKGRVVEVSVGDLSKDEENSFRKIKLRVDEVQGKKLLTSFVGMSFTSDKLRSLVRKWHTLIEANVDVKTTDGYLVRLFCIAFTKRRNGQVKKTTYAKSSQIKEIRKKMFEIMIREATSCDLKSLVAKFTPEVIGREIEKATFHIYPLQNIYIRKAKIVKSPKFDLEKLVELHGEITDVSLGFRQCSRVLTVGLSVGDRCSGGRARLQGAGDPDGSVILVLQCIVLSSAFAGPPVPLSLALYGIRHGFRYCVTGVTPPFHPLSLVTPSSFMVPLTFQRLPEREQPG